MWTKLALKNVAKSTKEYAIYFFTLAFGVCVFYMFNSIYAQQEIMEVTNMANESMEAISKLLGYVSVFVSVVLGFLIVYANHFFIRRRKKELGLYMTLGMEKRTISSILILETSVMAILALIVGLLSGIVLSQFMSVFTAKLFEANMTEYRFIFSASAFGKSIVCFGVIFFIVILFNTIAISKFTLLDLLYGGKKNETLHMRSLASSVIVFIVSVICLGIAYACIIKNGMIYMNKTFFSSLIFGIIGTVLFFYSTAGFMNKLVHIREKTYYRGLNMFVLRQLNSKINTNFISMSIVCIVLLLTIGIFSTGYSMQSMLSDQLIDSIPYDYSYLYFNNFNEDSEEKEQTSIAKALPEELSKSDYIKQEYEFYLYSVNGVTVDDSTMTWSEEEVRYLHKAAEFMKLSDYNALLALEGKKAIQLQKNEYTLTKTYAGMESFMDKIREGKVTFNNGNEILHYQESEEQIQIDNGTTTTTYIVPDQFVENLSISKIVYNVNCKDEESNEAYLDVLEKKRIERNYGLDFSMLNSKIQMYSNSISSKAIISFLAIYLGIVFMITCAAILAIQQLSEAADNKHRYELLRKLGADQTMLNRALFMQILCYFVCPLSLAIIHSIVGLGVANDALQSLGKVDITKSIFITAGFILFFYFMYFIMTYLGSKNIINRE